MPFDTGIRPALRALNRIPGVRTRASCQGKSSPNESGTHADFAYVLFRHPAPIAFEDASLAALADIARIDPDSIYSRWPERNAELCQRLEEHVVVFLDARRAERWAERRLRPAALLRPIESALSEDPSIDVVWCFDCAAVGTGSHDADCRRVRLVEGDPARRLALFARFVSLDATPPDPRLREREGDERVLARLERGDFGEAYRGAWRRFVTEAADGALRSEARERVRDERRAGRPFDLYFDRGEVVLAWRDA